MALTDSLSATIIASVDLAVNRSQSLGSFSGKDKAKVIHKNVFSDGSGTDQATGFFSSQFTATTGGITISLADSADPLGAAGDDVPTSDPEGLKLRAILITNEDSTNYVTLVPGTNAITSWFGAGTHTLRIPAGGVLLATFPAGLDALNDGVDDEIKITADTASVTVNIAYMFG